IALTIVGRTTFGATANVSPSSLVITNTNNIADPGARINVGAGGLNFTGAASPAIALGSGATPATLKLSGNVSVTGNTGGLAQILTSGSGGVDGTLDLNNALRTFT